MHTIETQISEEITQEVPASLDPQLLERAAQAALQAASAPDDIEMTVLLTGDRQIQELNRQFLDVDSPTDVLSFPADYFDPDTETKYLGDVIISLPRAQVQAVAGDHALEQELQLLVVHGVLHLLGYDHAEPKDKAEMWALQEKILKSIGNPLSPS
jgi:probable rRNA maturation factor